MLLGQATPEPKTPEQLAFDKTVHVLVSHIKMIDLSPNDLTLWTTRVDGELTVIRLSQERKHHFDTTVSEKDEPEKSSKPPPVIVRVLEDFLTRNDGWLTRNGPYRISFYPSGGFSVRACPLFNAAPGDDWGDICQPTGKFCDFIPGM